MKEVTEQVKSVLSNLIEEVKQLSKDESCDHSVGVCWCETFRRLEAAEELLNELNKGTSLFTTTIALRNPSSSETGSTRHPGPTGPTSPEPNPNPLEPPEEEDSSLGLGLAATGLAIAESLSSDDSTSDPTPEPPAESSLDTGGGEFGGAGSSGDF